MRCLHIKIWRNVKPLINICVSWETIHRYKFESSRYSEIRCAHIAKLYSLSNVPLWWSSFLRLFCLCARCTLEWYRKYNVNTSLNGTFSVRETQNIRDSLRTLGSSYNILSQRILHQNCTLHSFHIYTYIALLITKASDE